MWTRQEINGWRLTISGPAVRCLLSLDAAAAGLNLLSGVRIRSLAQVNRLYRRSQRSHLWSRLWLRMDVAQDLLVTSLNGLVDPAVGHVNVRWDEKINVTCFKFLLSLAWLRPQAVMKITARQVLKVLRDDSLRTDSLD
jgi:hypothetical protein